MEDGIFKTEEEQHRVESRSTSHFLSDSYNNRVMHGKNG